MHSVDHMAFSSVVSSKSLLPRIPIPLFRADCKLGEAYLERGKAISWRGTLRMGHVQSDKLLIGVSAEVCDLVHSWPDESDAPSHMLALSFPILFWANLQVCLGELLCFYVFCLIVSLLFSFVLSFVH